MQTATEAVQSTALDALKTKMYKYILINKQKLCNKEIL